jgi:hypothetical protein
MIHVVETIDTPIIIRSCSIACTHGAVNISVQTWTLPGVSIELCFHEQQLTSTITTSNDDICSPINSIASELIPQSTNFSVNTSHIINIVYLSNRFISKSLV